MHIWSAYLVTFVQVRTELYIASRQKGTNCCIHSICEKKKLLKILLCIKDETVSHTEEWYYNFSPLPYLYKKEIKWLNMENISSADFIIGL